MKKMKSFVCLTLAAVFTMTSSQVAFAAAEDSYPAAPASSTSTKSELYPVFEDYISNAIMLSDTISAFERDYDVTFDIKPQDITPETIAVNDEWLADANAFLDDYLLQQQARGARAATPSEPTSEQLAKASAIMYSMDRVDASLQRNPSIDPVKEAQYLFISHYIDRNDYYWSSNDERYLFDGATMSGENGYLADWLTDSDRQSYRTYMGYTGINTAINHVAKIALAIDSFKGTKGDLENGIAAFKKSDKVLMAGYNMTLASTAISAAQAMQEDVIPLVDQTMALLSSDPQIKLTEMYERYMEDEGLLSMYSEPDKITIVSTGLAIFGAFMVSGFPGLVVATALAIRSAALNLTLDTYKNFFNYTAWLALRYGFSGRYANRLMYFLYG